MARTAKCNCVGCTREGTVATMMPDRGGRMAWLCDRHAYGLESYSTENPNRYGDAKKHGGTFSIELETSYSDLQARAELVNFGFLPTSDCTVDVEYKSSIYEGLCAVSKQVITIDRLMSEGRLEMGEECGTHFHYGNRYFINPQTMTWIEKYYKDLFEGMNNLLLERTPEEVANFFGRDLTDRTHLPGQSGGHDGYAQSINFGYPMMHENWVNIQHDWTIEFRICKYRSGAQYAEVAKTIKAIGEKLVTEFLAHYNDRYGVRYDNADEWRRHCAKKASAKMVKILKDAIDRAN